MTGGAWGDCDVAQADVEQLRADDFTYPDDVEFGIDGGFEGIYDGVIIWVLKDGRRINRFRGEGSRREQLIDAVIAAQAEKAGGSK